MAKGHRVAPRSSIAILRRSEPASTAPSSFLALPILWRRKLLNFQFTTHDVGVMFRGLSKSEDLGLVATTSVYAHDTEDIDSDGSSISSRLVATKDPKFSSVQYSGVSSSQDRDLSWPQATTPEWATKTQLSLKPTSFIHLLVDATATSKQPSPLIGETPKGTGSTFSWPTQTADHTVGDEERKRTNSYSVTKPGATTRVQHTETISASTLSPPADQHEGYPVEHHAQGSMFQLDQQTSALLGALAGLCTVFLLLAVMFAVLWRRERAHRVKGEHSNSRSNLIKPADPAAQSSTHSEHYMMNGGPQASISKSKPRLPDHKAFDAGTSLKGAPQSPTDL